MGADPDPKSFSFKTMSVVLIVIASNDFAQAQLLVKPQPRPTQQTQIVFMPFREGAAVQNEVRMDSYIPTQILADRFYQFVDDEYLKSLVENLFVLPIHSYEPEVGMSPREREAFRSISKEVFSGPRGYVIGRKLVRDATRIYMNQTLYNWLVLRRRFYNEDIRHLPKHEKVQSSYRYVKRIVEQNNIRAMNVEEWKKEFKWFNDDLKKIESLCQDYQGQIRQIYAQLSKFKKVSSLINFDIHQYPDFIETLYPFGFDPSITGAYEHLFRQRIAQRIESSTEASSIYRYSLSSSVFGDLYDDRSSFQDHVGAFEPKNCSRKVSLSRLDSNSIPVIFESVAEKEQRYAETLEHLVENLESNDDFDILVKYLQENPTSIQLALLNEPNPQAVYFLSGMLLEKDRRDKIRRGRDIGIGILTLPLIWTKGLWAARIAFAVSTYFALSTAIDLRTTYQIENRVKESIQSGQISKERGMALIQTIRDQRPISYINLGLAGLSTVATGIRARQLGNMQSYVDAAANGGVQMGSRAEKAMIAKLSNPKNNPFRRTVKLNTMSDLHRDLVEGALAETLGGQQVTKETARLAKVTTRPPVPRLPAASAEDMLERVNGTSRITASSNKSAARMEREAVGQEVEHHPPPVTYNMVAELLKYKAAR
jgi:hypothetical protein